MKKLFISQPMRDKTEEQIFQERDRAIIAASKDLGEEVELIDTYITEDPPEVSNQEIWYLGKSLILLAQADIAYFVKGWKDYRGCKCEHKAAIEYNIPVIIEDE